MAAKKEKGEVRIGPGAGFPQGTKLEIRERIGLDTGKKAKTATVSKESEAVFTDLAPGQTFTVVGEVDGRPREVLVTSKLPSGGFDESPNVKSRLDPASVRAQLRQEALSQGTVGTPSEPGLRSTVSARPEGRQRGAAQQSAGPGPDAPEKDSRSVAEVKAAQEGGQPDDAAARKRSQAAKKAARTRKRNAAARARASRSKGDK